MARVGVRTKGIEVGNSQARTFFLNERQELSSFDREGGRQPAPLVGVNWQERATKLSDSLLATTQTAASRDPTAAVHHFVLAVPVAAVAKYSTSKRAATTGHVEEVPHFGGEQSKLFKRLGMDLLDVLPDGQASVHVPASRVQQVLSAVRMLPSANLREQSRWGTLEEFRPLSWTTRIDRDWLQELPKSLPVETFIRFQPTLVRSEVEEVLRALQHAVAGPHTRLLRGGREFSGRYWCAGLLTASQIESVAKEFVSIQSVHPRVDAHVVSSGRARKGARSTAQLPAFSVLPPTPIPNLPTVAVLDTGIPERHVFLAPYRRAGYRNPNLDPLVHYIGDHGSTVASCAVFGALDPTSSPKQIPPGSCRVMDVNIGVDSNRVDAELAVQAIQTILATAPEVRVFNLSFGGEPLDTFPPVGRREQLIKLQDLDNLAFASDILLVIAAGNSPSGLQPQEPYPFHVDDPRWALGTHARSFNGAVCGAYVATVGEELVAGISGAPSPFTRIGPGLCNSPVPGFGAPGGNSRPDYTWAPGAGILTCNAEGLWEDYAGTSVAAPLVAREAAWVFQELARRCGTATLPFAGTVKAWMHLVATRPTLPGAYETLAGRTLGQGLPTVERLQKPFDRSAVFVWQAVLQAPKSVARVQLPVPTEWLKRATAPHLRVVVSWNTPVNIALSESWACRKVTFKLRPFGKAEALTGKGRAIGGYPVVDRLFDIGSDTLRDKGFEPTDSPWVLETEYDEIGEYPPAMTVSPQQRVGVAIELWDNGDQPTSPQTFIETSANVMELDRLSVLQQPLEPAVVVRV